MAQLFASRSDMPVRPWQSVWSAPSPAGSGTLAASSPWPQGRENVPMAFTVPMSGESDSESGNIFTEVRLVCRRVALHADDSKACVVSGWNAEESLARTRISG